MNRTLLALAGVVSVATVISAQCALGDHPNCANWKRNGFCVNGAYTKIQKQQYCPSCPEAGCNGAATTAAPKENANCGTWNTDPKNVFCGSDIITKKQKETFCFTTCKAEISPPAWTGMTVEIQDNKDKCAVYVQSGTAPVARKVAVASIAPAIPTFNATTAGDKVLFGFAQTKCKLTLYDIAAPVLNPTPGPVTVPIETVDGTAADKYLNITGTKQDAKAYSCACTA